MTRLLHELVSRHAERRPDAIAVVMQAARLSYRDLDEASNQLARALRAAGCKPGDRVGLFLPKSPWAIIAMLAASKADCIHVPIDLASPAKRVARIVRSAEPACILAADPAERLLEEVLHEEGIGAAPPVGWLDRVAPAGARFDVSFTLDEVRSGSMAPLACKRTGTDAAHLLFTSGSTGQPKGVVITHDNVLRFVEWARAHFRIGSADRTSGHSPLHFDLSTFDIYGAFAAGAQLHLVPPELNLLPNKLAEFIRASELTQWFSVPSALAYMTRFDVVEQGDFRSLKRILWCGEVLPTTVLIHLMRLLPHVTFTNLYGPTETTIASSHYTVPSCPTDERAAIPIGRPCGGEELLVLDERLAPAPAGQVGQLYIRGAGLSPGYWRDPDKTAEAFIARPPPAPLHDRIYRTGDLAKVGPDGLVYFIGRADTQIKSRGYRIELGEVESALHTLSSLEDCAVVAIGTGGFEGAVICCAFTAAAGADVSAGALRQALSEILPAYMLPSRWLKLDALPRNANGKTDRRALADRFERDEHKTA